MSTFSVVLLTAAPNPGMELGGAYVKIDGRESVLRAVELFLNRDNIKQIQLVVLPANMEEAKTKYGGHLGFSGVKLISGGPGWVDQIAAAAANISAECTHVMIHDAARPAVAFSDIDSITADADKHPVIALATTQKSPLAQVDHAGKATALFSPQEFLQLVTPWCFKRERFLEVAKSNQEPAVSEIHLLKGWPNNVRIGHSGDASLAKAMIALLPKPKMRASDNPFQEAQW